MWEDVCRLYANTIPLYVRDLMWIFGIWGGGEGVVRTQGQSGKPSLRSHKGESGFIPKGVEPLFKDTEESSALTVL